MCVQLSGLNREAVAAVWARGRFPSPQPPLSMGARGWDEGAATLVADRERILAFAVGKPSEAFGDPYRPFDHGRFIARLPGPPYSFLDRLVNCTAEPFVTTATRLLRAV